jgi:hypothetical protein
LVISKLFEYAILPTLAENFTQSTLQFGFTKGMSMLMVGFLFSETRGEAKYLKQVQYIICLLLTKEDDFEYSHNKYPT